MQPNKHLEEQLDKARTPLLAALEMLERDGRDTTDVLRLISSLTHYKRSLSRQVPWD